MLVLKRYGKTDYLHFSITYDGSYVFDLFDLELDY